MKWKILTIGKPSLAYARSGADEYLRRLRRHGSVEVISLKESGPEKNARQLLEASEGSHRLVLDETGESMSSEEWATQIQSWELGRVKSVAVLIGGADGHTDEVRQAADSVLRLSKFTLQHELALVVFLEQLYRAYTIRRGEPYHR